MPRTRDALIIVVGLVCITVVAGFVVTRRGEETKGVVREYSTQEAIFVTPHEAYSVTPYIDDSFSDSRELFIKKVRSTYPKEKHIGEPDVTISAPVIETIPSETTTPPYGDTRL